MKEEQVGIVSPVSLFYSFSLSHFWPLGKMVTEEGVRNVSLLSSVDRRKFST